jgi:hypothetical protein
LLRPITGTTKVPPPCNRPQPGHRGTLWVGVGIGAGAGVACRKGRKMDVGFSPRGKTRSGGRPGPVGRGFNPGTKPAESTRASAPEVCFSQCSFENRPFSAACLYYSCSSEISEGAGGFNPLKDSRITGPLGPGPCHCYDIDPNYNRSI